MADCCLIKKVATVYVYENKNDVRSYGYMVGDRNTPIMEVEFLHKFGVDDLTDCMLRYVIVSDVGDLVTGDVPISKDRASIQLPNSIFNGEKQLKVQLTVASCDGSRILNLQQFTDLKIVNNLTESNVTEPIYDIFINKLYDLANDLTNGITPLFNQTKIYADEVRADRNIVVSNYNGFKESVANEKNNIANLSLSEQNKIKSESLKGLGDVKSEGEAKISTLSSDYLKFKNELELIVDTNSLLHVSSIMGDNYKGIYDSKNRYLPGEVFYKISREFVGFSIPQSSTPAFAITQFKEEIKRFMISGEVERVLEISRNQDVGIVGLYLGERPLEVKSEITTALFPIITDVLRFSIPADDNKFLPITQTGLDIKESLIKVTQKDIIDRKICVGTPALYQY